MRKLLCILLAVVMVISFSAVVFAEEVNEPGLDYFTLDEVTVAPYSVAEASMTPYATHYFSFQNLNYWGITSDVIEYEVQEGETLTLNIVSCTWVPHTCDLWIGIYDLDTGWGQYYPFSGGNCSGYYEFPDLSEGRYMIYIRNISSKTVSEGSIRYSLT